MKVSHLLRWGFISLFLATSLVMSGCSQIKKTGANMALGFTEDNLILPLFRIDDTAMACVSGEALTPLIIATQGMKADPNEIAVLLYASAGLCAEQRALEYELRYMRSSKANLIDDAQDARIMQKREAELAARRQYESYKHLEAYFEVKKKAPIGTKCPKFSRDFDQMVYLLGILVVATRFGRGPSLLASLLSVAAFDFIFVPPYFTFVVSDFRHVGTFSVMLLVGVVIGNLTERIRAQARLARAREQRTQVLFRLGQELARSAESTKRCLPPLAKTAPPWLRQEPRTSPPRPWGWS